MGRAGAESSGTVKPWAVLPTKAHMDVRPGPSVALQLHRLFGPPSSGLPLLQLQRRSPRPSRRAAAGLQIRLRLARAASLTPMAAGDLCRLPFRNRRWVLPLAPATPLPPSMKTSAIRPSTEGRSVIFFQNAEINSDSSFTAERNILIFNFFYVRASCAYGADSTG